jgi:hypothetical protein
MVYDAGGTVTVGVANRLAVYSSKISWSMRFAFAYFSACSGSW